jgi:hypothetical protein
MLYGFPRGISTRSVQPIRVELVADHACFGEGFTVCADAPVLEFCRRLVELGYDPDRPLQAYRGQTLALTVTSIRAGAESCINGKGSGFMKRRVPVGIASPIRKSAVRGHPCPSATADWP